jgi:hypothetical protein
MGERYPSTITRTTEFHRPDWDRRSRGRTIDPPGSGR